jgi:uncharacterized membrane protein
VDLLRYQQLGLIGKIGKPGFERQTQDQTAADRQASKQVAALPIESKRVKVSFVNTAAYSPVAYIPAALGIKIGMILKLSVGHTLYLARIFGFMAFLASVSYALFTLRKTNLKWIIFGVALLPLVVFQAALITADSMLFTTILLFSGLLLKSWLPNQRLSTADKILLGIAAVMLPLVKSVYAPFVALVLFAPVSHWKTTRQRYVFMSLVLTLSAIGFLVWGYLTKDIAASNGLVRGDPFWHYGFAAIQTKFALHHPFGVLHAIINSLIYQSRFYVDTTFGWLGFNYLPIPGVAQLADFLALGLSILIVEPFTRKQRKYGIALLGMSLVVTFLIFTTLYLTYTIIANSVVEGVQGRYLLPFFPLCLAGLAFLAGKFRLAKPAYASGITLLVSLISFGLILSTVRYGLAIL